MQRVARFALALGFGLITIGAVLKALSRETMVNLVWLSFLPAAIVLSACGQDAPEPATSTATPLPTAMPVPTATTHIPAWLPTAVANAPGSTFVPAATPVPTARPIPTVAPIPTATRDLSALSLPTAGYVGKDYATGACNLHHLAYGAPRRLHGLSFFLTLEGTRTDQIPPWIEMRLSVQNYTDEPIDYASATIFAMVNRRSCEIFWREPHNDYFGGFRYETLQPGEVKSRSVYWHYATHDGPTPAGDYVGYAIYRFADPPESNVPNAAVYVPAFGVTIGIDPVLRPDPSSAHAEPALRTIDLWSLEPLARRGRKLTAYDEGIGTNPSRYYEIDLDTGERTEIPKPEYAVPQRSCEPPKGLKLEKELVFLYAEYRGPGEGYPYTEPFDVKGILEIELDTGVATAWVLAGTPTTGYDKRFLFLYNPRVGPIVWSDDCRYAAWTMNTSCDVLPHGGPFGAFLYDTETDTMTRVSDEPSHVSVSFWDDLLVYVPVCFAIYGTTGVFLE